MLSLVTTLLLSSAPDRDSVSALAIADRFMEAWRMRRGAEGMALLSPRLRGATKYDDLFLQIVGLSNPHHVAYEIHEGKWISASKVAFGVRTYETYTGHERSGPQPPLGRLVLVRSQGGWKVDGLPVAESTENRKVTRILTADYEDALATANRFLGQWRSEQRAKVNAYELTDGVSAGRGAYSFAVHRRWVDTANRLHDSSRPVAVARGKDGAWKVLSRAFH